jgi:diguanylate cyclase (GGDEF)-like protein/PAS domain S-box-containing protein
VGYLDWVDALPPNWLAIAVLVVGVVSALLLGRAGLDSAGTARRAWLAMAATFLGWTLSLAGVLFGLPDYVNWAVARPITLISMCIGVLSFPGVQRSLRQWVVVALDGWMSVGGIFVITWMILRDPSVSGPTLINPFLINPGMLGWAVVDQLVLCALAGLLARAASGGRRPVAFVVAAGVFASTGDLIWALTGRAAPGILLWLIGIAMVGAGPLIGGSQLFSGTFLDSRERREIRLSQLPLLPSLFFLFGPFEPDRTATLGAMSVLVVCFGNVVAHSKQNARLLATVSEQSVRYSTLLSDSRDAIMQLDGENVVVFANDAAGHMLGVPAAELIGQQLGDFVHPDDLTLVVGQSGPVAKGFVDAIRIEYRIGYRTGGYRYVESTVSRRGDAGGWVFSTRDITDRVLLRNELTRQARTDPLTNLLNRAAFLDLVERRLGSGQSTRVLFMDLDEFKAVNDTLGHAAGDELLCRVAGMLTEVIDPADAVARLGGDEFAVLSAAGDEAGATITADSILAALASLTPVDARHDHPPSASIGIAAAQGGSGVDLLGNADLAMYRAKAVGGGRYEIFELWMKERVIERSQALIRLEAAITAGGLLLELQPVVDLGTGTWTGFEALVRWQDGDTRRPPDDFIPLAEESGLVIPMGTWVLGEALEQLAVWPDPEVGMAVNVSPRQLEREDFGSIVLAALARTGIQPGRLTLEITERTAVADLGRAASRLGPLRDLGVHISIDDFGTGYSSMRYLTRLPIDALKIDQKFVAGLGLHREDEVLVVSMIRLAADLDLEVIAEGVETPLQAELLRRHGCRLAQGYLFSRPKPLDELRRIRASEKARAESGSAASIPRLRRPSSSGLPTEPDSTEERSLGIK